MASILATTRLGANAFPTTITVPAGAEPDDLLVVMTFYTSSSGVTVPSAVAANGVPMTARHASARGTVWSLKGVPAGAVEITATGSNPAHAIFVVRGAAEVFDCETVLFVGPTGGTSTAPPIASTPVEVGATQAILALSTPCDTLASSGTLPAPGAWTVGGGSSTTKSAYAVPATPAVYSIEATRNIVSANGAKGIVRVVVGTAPPAAPTDLILTPTSTSITATWSAPATGPAPTGYEVRLDTGATIAVTGTSHVFEGLAPETQYLVAVRSVGLGGVSAWQEAYATTAAPHDPNQRPASAVASQAVLALAGLDPAPGGPASPAQQWWRVDATDAATYDPDRSEGLVGYSIGYGSRDPLGKPAPLAVGVTLLVPLGGSVTIGERFKLRLSPALAEALALPPGAEDRVTAIVTDAQADPMRSWDLPGHGPAILWTVTATGYLARYGAAPVDGTEWPVEPVGARIRRILDSLALTGDVDATGPNVRPPGTTGSHHQALAAAVDSTLGRLVEQTTGLVDFHDLADRRGTLPALTIDSAEILGDGFTWRQSVGDVVNSAEISYGPEAGAKVTVSDPSSMDARTGVGPYPAQVSTMLDSEVDAYGLAGDIVGRRAWPFFQLPAVQVDLARSGLDVERLAALFGITLGQRVAMTSMPSGSPWENLPRGCFVEGYTEQASAYAWRMALVVSDPAMSGVGLRYIDVTEGISYDDVAEGISYLDVARIEDPVDLL